MPLLYGFMLAPDGHIAIDQEKADIVRTVYQQYLSGASLKGIADFLFAQGIPSPRGKAQWTQAVISDLLSNQRYIGPIVRFDDFFMAQGEKGKRSNIDEDTNQRKATRYNSQSVLSGLLTCGNVGATTGALHAPLAKWYGAVPIEWSTESSFANIRHLFQSSRSKMPYAQILAWLPSMSRQ